MSNYVNFVSIKHVKDTKIFLLQATVLTITTNSSLMGPKATSLSGPVSGRSYLKVVPATSYALGQSITHCALI